MAAAASPGGECRRLTAAVAEGRYIQAPEQWRAHVATCSPCAERVEGLLAAQNSLDGAMPAGAPDPVTEQHVRDVLIALDADRRRRARRLVFIIAGLLLVATAAAIVAFWGRASGSRDSSPPTQRSDRRSSPLERNTKPEIPARERPVRAQ